MRPTEMVDRVEAPVTTKAYLLCVFGMSPHEWMQRLTPSASFGGIYFGYDTGWIGGVLG